MMGVVERDNEFLAASAKLAPWVAASLLSTRSFSFAFTLINSARITASVVGPYLCVLENVLVESTEGSDRFIYSGGNKESDRSRCQARFVGSG